MTRTLTRLPGRCGWWRGRWRQWWWVWPRGWESGWQDCRTPCSRWGFWWSTGSRLEGTQRSSRQSSAPRWYPSAKRPLLQQRTGGQNILFGWDSINFTQLWFFTVAVFNIASMPFFCNNMQGNNSHWTHFMPCISFFVTCLILKILILKQEEINYTQKTQMYHLLNTETFLSVSENLTC